jgi:hypothetical protein
MSFGGGIPEGDYRLSSQYFQNQQTTPNYFETNPHSLHRIPSFFQHIQFSPYLNPLSFPNFPQMTPVLQMNTQSLPLAHQQTLLPSPAAAASPPPPPSPSPSPPPPFLSLCFFFFYFSFYFFFSFYSSFLFHFIYSSNGALPDTRDSTAPNGNGNRTA